MMTKIEYWKSKFRLLDAWDITYGAPSDDKKRDCRCYVDLTNKQAWIYECNCVSTEEYIFHEILHIVIRIMDGRFPYERGTIYFDNEEIFVQDLIKIFLLTGGEDDD